MAREEGGRRPVLWIPITLGAASLQVARNAAQRGLLAEAGPWGATLARFLFGLPFAFVFLFAATLVGGAVSPKANGVFFLACAVGGAAQIVATAAMLVSMRRSSFALGTVFQQSSIPLAAIIGMAFGEHLGPFRWLGLGLVTTGLMALGWPRGVAGASRLGSAALLGVVAGAGFALAANAFRQAALSLDPTAPVFAALATLLAVQLLQTAALVAWLALTDPTALRAVVTGWRASLPAGLFGAAASGLWFTAFALSPAGPVRAVGVTEMPIAALAGRRLFAERLTAWQMVLLAQIAIGVGLAALG
jgi:drug/metabolite transporter (DMT)-like permease